MTNAMQILKLEIGSPEWEAIRRKYKVASEAPVMMGASPHMKRSELIGMKSTGVERVINEWVEKFVFKRGHDTEALARPIAEARLEDDLFPLVGVRTVEGLDLLASYDGITAPMYDIHWEHKQYNKELFELVQSGGELEPKHYWQLEHQCLVNNNDSCIFAVSDGTEENYAELEYHSRPERRAQLIEGWKLFDKDMEAYVHEDEKPAAVGETIKDLPSLVVEIAGEVRKSNLAVYKSNALDFIRNINTDLQTDEDFATAKNVVKFLAEKGKELVGVERKILSQAEDIDEVVRTVKQLKEEMDSKRLQLDKLVKSEELNRKNEILSAAKDAWTEHYNSLNATLTDSVTMPEIESDFAGAVKGKRTLATYKEAAQNELARLRIEANVEFKQVQQNLQSLKTIAAEHMFLFRDIQQLVLKDPEAMEAIARQRITEHQTAEEARVKAEAERLAEEKERARKAEEAAEEARKIAEAEAQEQAAEQEPEPEPTAEQMPPAARDTGNRPFHVIASRQNPSAAPAMLAESGTQAHATSASYTATSPSDALLVKVIASHFKVSMTQALDWVEHIDIATLRAWINEHRNAIRH